MLPHAAGLRLHHVGYLVRELGPAAEVYRQRFGYVAATGPVHDPLQTAHVQFLQLSGDCTWLELIAPDGPTSRLAAEAARNQRPLHHLCFRAPGPLEDHIASLREQGMVLIGEPQPATVFDGRRICWLMGADRLPVELVEARSDEDACFPGGWG